MIERSFSSHGCLPQSTLEVADVPFVSVFEGPSGSEEQGAEGLNLGSYHASSYLAFGYKKKKKVGKWDKTLFQSFFISHI